MGVINGTIGPAQFYAVQHNLTSPQRGYIDFSESWENGHGYAETGYKGEIEELLCFADFDSPIEAKAALTFYTYMMRTVQLIRIREGTIWVPYFNYKILSIRNVTEVPYSPTVSGGIKNGNYERITRWTVQNMTGVW